MNITLENLPEFTQEFLKNISLKNWKAESGATVILLHGNLGAGKTTFTKTFAKLLGVEEEVTSPTFVLMKRYELPNSNDKKDETLKQACLPARQVQGDTFLGFKNLIHIDAYRLESGEEIEALDFKEYISDKENIILIEWPEKIESAIELIPQQNIITLDFEVVDETTREILVITNAKDN